MVIEEPGNVQTEILDASFALWTFLQADNSVGGQAIGDFGDGGIEIRDSSNVLLFAATVNDFVLEESAALPFAVLAGPGDFTVTGGTWQSSFGPAGIVLDLTWKITDSAGQSTDIDDFQTAFLGESDVTPASLPEPTTLAALGLSGLALLRRRRRR